MPSSTAYRPGDIITTLSGKTIEVLNTDARIILSDALFYAQRYAPAAIVELSTLTGAIIIALGAHATGMMATDQALADKLSRAGNASSERVWQLPLWEEYHAMVKSEIADLKNIGRALLLVRSTRLAPSWQPSWATSPLPISILQVRRGRDKPAKPYDTQGGTGVGVRLLVEFLQGYSQ